MAECELIRSVISYEVTVACPNCGEVTTYLDEPPTPGGVDSDPCDKCGTVWVMCEYE